MPVPSSAKLRQVAGLVDRIGNFGGFPPTVAFRDAFKAHGVCLNLHDPAIAEPAKAAAQIAGIRSHDCWAGVWEPVPPGGDDGALRAVTIDAAIDRIDLELVKLDQPKIDIVWLNLEGYTIAQWQAFLWGKPGGIKGWRGVNGSQGSAGGVRSGVATGVVDEPFKDGSVKPMVDLMVARVMLAVEGFYGPTAQWPDMTPADHPRAIVDRITGYRNGGQLVAAEAWPADQVVGCYDAALGAIVRPSEPLLIRSGLLFTLERARNVGLI